MKKTPSTRITIKNELTKLSFHPQNATFPMDFVIKKSNAYSSRFQGFPHLIVTTKLYSIFPPCYVVHVLDQCVTFLALII